MPRTVSKVGIWLDSTYTHAESVISNYYKSFEGRHFQDVLEDENCYAEDVLKTCLEYILKTCLEHVLKTCLEDVLKTCLEDVLKTLWRKTKYLLGISISNKSKYLSHESYFTNLYLAILRRIQNALIRTQ